MTRRRSVARLAWALPLVAAVGAIAVTSDADFVAPSIQAMPSSIATPTSSEPTQAPTTEQVVIETNAATTELAPSLTHLDTTLPPSSPQPTVATNEYVLDIPPISLSQPVVAGDQAQIDAGSVTAVDWSQFGYPTSCLPDQGCTIWLAGHRSTHGAVFAHLPEVTVGASVEIQFHGRLFDYTVREVANVPSTSPPSVIHGDLVLQTSLPGDRRMLVYADLLSR